jgi:hypothetical protein
MREYGLSEWVVAAAMLAVGVVPSQVASGAVGSDETLKLAEAAATARQMFGVANLTMHFVQEDGPSSGHVRVLLTPEIRPLTILEARDAAQQAFLETLTEPGLGGDLKRITIVVRLMPATHPDPGGAEQRIVFLRKSARTWSVLPGE